MNTTCIHYFVIMVGFMLALISATIQAYGQTITTDYSQYGELEIEITPISIPIDYRMEGGPAYSYQQWDNVLYCYNGVTQNLELYDLNALKPLPFINLAPLCGDSTFPRGKIKNAYITNWDSIWVLQEFRVALIDKDGNLLNAWQTDADDYSLDAYHGQWDRMHNFYCDGEKGLCYLRRLNANCQGETFYLCPTYSIEATLDLSTGKIDTLPICYSPAYKEKYYGRFMATARCQVGNKHYYCFEADPNIYMLDLATNTVAAYGGRSKYHGTDTLFNPYGGEMEMQEELKLYLKCPQYIGIWYYPSQKLFFRLFLQEQQLKSPKLDMLELWNKNMYLQVFNEELQLLGEVPLDATYTFWPWMSTDGLMLAKRRKNFKKPSKTLDFDRIVIKR